MKMVRDFLSPGLRRDDARLLSVTTSRHDMTHQSRPAHDHAANNILTNMRFYHRQGIAGGFGTCSCWNQARACRMPLWMEEGDQPSSCRAFALLKNCAFRA